MVGQGKGKVPTVEEVTGQIEAVALGGGATTSPTSPTVPSVTLIDDPPINFKEASPARPAPPPARCAGGAVTPLDKAQELRIRNLGKDLDYPPRTGARHPTGSGKVVTNHFRIQINSKAVFYEYQINGIPDHERRASKKRYMNTAIQSVPFLRNNINSFATDHVKTIISWVNLHQMAPGPQAKQGKQENDEGAEWRLVDITDKDTTPNLNLQYVRRIDIQALRDFTTTTLPSSAVNNSAQFNPLLAVNALNIIMKKCISPQNTLKLNDHKFYVRDAFFDIRSGSIAPLRGMRGYAYVVKPGMGGILLNVGPATSAFWRPLLVSEVLSGGLGPFGGDPMALKGLRVYITYERGGNVSGEAKGEASSINDQQHRVKIVRDFGKPCNAQIFELVKTDAGGREQKTRPTVAQYQQQEYKRTLASPGLPAVNVGTFSNPTWIAPEHLRILPDQIYGKVIPEIVARDFHTQSCRSPAETRSKIEAEGLSFFPRDAQGLLIGCPLIRLQPAMLNVPAATLPYSRVLYKNARTVSITNTGGWNLDQVKFFKGGDQPLRWKLIVAPGIRAEVVTEFGKSFADGIRSTGAYSAIQHQGQPLHVTAPDNEEALKHQLKAMLVSTPGSPPGIMVLLLNRRDVDIYSKFKYLADKVFLVHSICASAQTFEKQRTKDQYMANIAMKANLKHAGINHSVDGVSTILNETLVLGADVTHPGTGALRGTPSIAAVVGSLDASGGQFPGRMQTQDSRQEVITDMHLLVRGLLYDWYTKHNRWPKNVLYYRDGVSESQFAAIITEELPEIQKAFEEVGSRLKLTVPTFNLTAVIVSKRHNTRFFPAQQADAMRNGNCKPGTLVDSIVTSPYYADFFLQSHNGIKGTARSCHYFVLRNEMPLTTQQLQTLTHNLCHTYVRATLAVSYASPAYYADRLCERGRAYLRDFFSPNRAARDAHHAAEQRVKMQVERTRAAARDPRSRDAKMTREQRDEEARDKEAVEQGLKSVLDPRVKARWDVQIDADVGVETRKGGWLRTMYWM